MMQQPWPTEHEDYLRELASCGGLSREEMANLLNGRFGTSYTRNSVIGKCGRLGLCSPMPKRRGKNKRPVAASTRAVERPATIRAGRGAGNAPEPCPLECSDTRPRPEYGRFKLLDLREGDCRWPAGYGPYLFCGRPICAGSSYCAEHYAASTRLPYRWEARA